MSEPLLSLIVGTREQAHEGALAAYKAARAIVGKGRMAVVEVREAEEPVRVAQRRLLHGPVLTQISEQATIDGVRYPPLTWKELFRTMFLPDGGFKWTESRDPYYCYRRKRTIKPRKPRIIKERVSTESLGVALYAKFTEDVIQYAANDLGVVFVFKREEDEFLRARHQRPRSTLT